MLDSNIKRLFTYHPPDENKLLRHNLIQDAGKEFALIINSFCFSTRESEEAIKKIEEAVMWANKAIEVNE